MINTEKYGGITWVDLHNPTQEEIDSVERDYNIHELTSAELHAPSERSKVDPYKNYIYAILHFPNIHHDHNQKDIREIDFILGKKFIITCHYQDTPVLEQFRNAKLPEEVLGEHKTLPHAGMIFYHMMRHLYQSYDDELNEIESDLAQIEENIFSGHEKDMVELLGIVSHDIMDIKRALKSHASILASLDIAGKEFYGAEYRYHLHAMTGEYQKVWMKVEDMKETLHDLRETNDSLLSSKTNDVMKVLTIMAFITFPLSLLAGIFGMNTAAMPIVGSTGDFWVIIAIMIAASVSMVIYFKRKGWF